MTSIVNDYSFLRDPTFLAKRKANDYHYFGHIDVEPLTWEEAILDLEYHISNRKDYKHETTKNLFFVLQEPSNPKALEILREFSKLDPTLHPEVHLYVTFMADDRGGNGRHNDISDVIFWQTTGKTEWMVESKTGNKTHILEPGDAIYVPVSMWHTVTSLTPRSGLSIGLTYKELYPGTYFGDDDV